MSSLSNSVQQELEQLRADYARQAAELARCNDLLSQIRQEVRVFLFSFFVFPLVGSALHTGLSDACA
jgi:hypothetical protein